MQHGGLLNRQTVGKKSNISSETAETVNFHFSHYKSTGTLSCHSNQISYPTGIKNTTFVEANVLSMYAKFQLHHLIFAQNIDRVYSLCFRALKNKKTKYTPVNTNFTI